MFPRQWCQNNARRMIIGIGTPNSQSSTLRPKPMSASFFVMAVSWCDNVHNDIGFQARIAWRRPHEQLIGRFDVRRVHVRSSRRFDSVGTTHLPRSRTVESQAKAGGTGMVRTTLPRHLVAPPPHLLDSRFRGNERMIIPSRPIGFYVAAGRPRPTGATLSPLRRAVGPG
jgi:hypothetical protein